MQHLVRFLKHLPAGKLSVRRAFPGAALGRIEQAIAESERFHDGEIRFVVESGLEASALLQRVSPRQRALDVFSRLRVWDTENNNGILIYLLLADRDVEIVADRGIAARVPQASWEEICRTMEGAFARGEFTAGVLAGIERAGTLLREHFPPRPGNPDELPNRPVIL